MLSLLMVLSLHWIRHWLGRFGSRPDKCIMRQMTFLKDLELTEFSDGLIKQNLISNLRIWYSTPKRKSSLSENPFQRKSPLPYVNHFVIQAFQKWCSLSWVWKNGESELSESASDLMYNREDASPLLRRSSLQNRGEEFLTPKGFYSARNDAILEGWLERGVEWSRESPPSSKQLATKFNPLTNAQADFDPQL